ncbi:hypothetical protein QYE76_014996 [Lolium multiflorum]|uniref:Uncharacterized protein n=1 Tax=Lolium multiflorum TaxID=4521 RepID=A0AAD8X997_LOLMU|nr:hypothetical protein QYE76_014996 [Lolium multiflorum]
MSSEGSLPAATSSTQDSSASDGMDLASSRKQEAGTSSRASGKDKTRGAWRGSDVTQFEIDWLYRSGGVIWAQQRDPAECSNPTTFFYVRNAGDEDLINCRRSIRRRSQDHGVTRLADRQTDMPEDWEWGLCPLSARNPPSKEAKARFPRIDSDRRGPCRKRPLDKYDPDPVIHWLDLRMGRTASARLGKSPPEPAGSSDDLTILETLPQPATTHRSTSTSPPCRPRLGEFLDKLMAEGQKSDPPAAGAGPSHASSGKRPRTEVIGGKQVGTKRYKQKRMPMSSGFLPAREDLNSSSSLKPGTIVGNSSASLSGGTTSRGARPQHLQIRAEEDFTSPPETQDTGASNIGAGRRCGQAEPLVPPPPKKKKKQPSSSPTAPDTSAPVPSPPTKATPTPPPSQGPSAAKQPAPSGTPKITNFLKPGASRGKAVEGAASSGSGDVVLHVGPAALAAQDKPTGLLGRIVTLKRAGKDLGHLLPYAQKWNEADISASTRGLGKDRLPAPDPAGARCTEEHFSRLKRAVKEFDSAWYDATNNVVSTADARKQLFEELLWEHRDLAEAHSHCQAVPEATIEALKAQVAKLQGEKEQLLKEHNEALEAQKTALGELKEQAIQAALRHDQALKDARVAAEARLAEVVEDSTNANTVLTAELEEERKSRKAAERLIDTMTTDHREYDRLVMKIDALALQHFPESQVYALKKVREDRIAREFPNLDAHWDGYDYLVALSARVQHMRSVDRLLRPQPPPSKSSRSCGTRRSGEHHAARDNDAGHRIMSGNAPRLVPELTSCAPRVVPDLNLDALQVSAPSSPPSGVKDYLGDEEEEDEGDEGEAARTCRKLRRRCSLKMLRLALHPMPLLSDYLLLCNVCL